ncbi:activin receptor type-1B-like [Halichondria panicea]|uniref:activin receptor type-1B-like n=2 Tax=Halichondria panicea TaxID=6063 RepID=UPI00312BC929
MVQGLPDGTITAIVVTLAIIALVVVMFAIGVIFFCWKRCRNDEYLVTNDTGRPYPTYTGSRPNLTGLLLSEAVLGEGSDGVVYEGTYQENKVAVKVFRENSRERFFREVAVYTSSSVDHQNILKFIGHDEKEMRLVVALHTRGSVYTVIQRQVLTLAEFQLLGKSISCGLGFLHRSRPPCIVHGDLKTGNILMKHNGEAALADFGHSRQFFTEDVKEPMTAGTPMYAAPELMKVRVNSRTDAKATDSYSLGVVIYELLTRTQRDQEEVEAYRQPMSEKLDGIQQPTIDEMRRHIHNNSYRPNIPKKFDVFPELVKLVQDLWSDAAETRPKAEAAYNAFIEFGLLIASRSLASTSCTDEHLSHQSSLETAETAF